MHVLQRLLVVPSAGPAAVKLITSPHILATRRSYSCLPATSAETSVAVEESVTPSQLVLLNSHGVLPSIARQWDSKTADVELRAAHASGNDRPTAVQVALAQRHGISLSPAASRRDAAATLAAALPPPLRSLAILYGVLGYDGAVPPSAAAARRLLKQLAQSREHAHALDTDLSPVSMGQMSELYGRLGYIGRPPFSYAAAQTLAVCLRTILADVEEEARLRPLMGLTARQADLIRYLRTRRVPPGTRGMPAVLDVDLDPLDPLGAEAGSGSGRRGVSRLAAARNILQLLQNHELSDLPRPNHIEALRALGHTGPMPPCAGEALMLARELRDRCELPSTAQLAALRAAGYGAAAASGAAGTGAATAAAAPPPPPPESVAHVKAILRVLRRADTDAATPAAPSGLRHLAGLHCRASPALHTAAAAAAAESDSVDADDAGLAPCPSQLEVRAAIEELPVSEVTLDRLVDLGWPGPMPATHGSAVALEEALVQHSSRFAPLGAHLPSGSASSGPGPAATLTTHGSHGSATSVAYRRAGGGGGHLPQRHSGAQGHLQGSTSAPSGATGAGAVAGAAQQGAPSAPPDGSFHHQQEAQLRIADFVSRLGSRDPAEALAKIQIRGLFPGAVSEWHLRSMCGEEAAHLLGCMTAARRLVLDRVRTTSYDEYVERWAAAEADGDWWGVEWLWI